MSTAYLRRTSLCAVGLIFVVILASCYSVNGAKVLPRSLVHASTRSLVHHAQALSRRQAAKSHSFGPQQTASPRFLKVCGPVMSTLAGLANINASAGPDEMFKDICPTFPVLRQCLGVTFTDMAGMTNSTAESLLGLFDSICDTSSSADGSPCYKIVDFDDCELKKPVSTATGYECPTPTRCMVSSDGRTCEDRIDGFQFKSICSECAGKLLKAVDRMSAAFSTPSHETFAPGFERGSTSGGITDIFSADMFDVNAMQATRHALCAKTEGKYCFTELGLDSDSDRTTTLTQFLDGSDALPFGVWSTKTADIVCKTPQNEMCFRRILYGLLLVQKVGERAAPYCRNVTIESMKELCEDRRQLSGWKLRSYLAQTGMCHHASAHTGAPRCLDAPATAISQYPTLKRCVRAAYDKDHNGDACPTGCNAELDQAVTKVFGCCSAQLFPAVPNSTQGCGKAMQTRISTFPASCSQHPTHGHQLRVRRLGRTILLTIAYEPIIEKSETVEADIIERLIEDVAALVGLPEVFIKSPRLAPNHEGPRSRARFTFHIQGQSDYETEAAASEFDRTLADHLPLLPATSAYLLAHGFRPGKSAAAADQTIANGGNGGSTKGGTDDGKKKGSGAGTIVAVILVLLVFGAIAGVGIVMFKRYSKQSRSSLRATDVEFEDDAPRFDDDDHNNHHHHAAHTQGGDDTIEISAE